VASAEGAKVDAEATLAVARALPPGMRSSMQKDVERGRPPELDAIGGPILRGAARHSLEAPATQRLVAAVEQKVRPTESRCRESRG
jgi:2-dehydropantoate 2-reductase